MLNNPTQVTYSVQHVAGRGKILATEADQTRAVVTLEGAAPRACAALNQLARNRTILLHVFGTEHTGQVCTLRRAFMATVINGPRPTGPAGVDELADAVSTATNAQKRAIADEVGRLLAGSDDIMVPVTITGEFGESQFYALANDWLTDDDDPASDQDILEAVDPYGPSGVLYEGLLADLRTRDIGLEEALESTWHDVKIDHAALIAWAGRNRPHLSAAVADLLAD